MIRLTQVCDEWVCYSEEMVGMAETGDTKEEAVREFLISLKVKLAYDFELNIDKLFFGIPKGVAK